MSPMTFGADAKSGVVSQNRSVGEDALGDGSSSTAHSWRRSGWAERPFRHPVPIHRDPWPGR